MFKETKEQLEIEMKKIAELVKSTRSRVKEYEEAVHARKDQKDEEIRVLVEKYDTLIQIDETRVQAAKERAIVTMLRGHWMDILLTQLDSDEKVSDGKLLEIKRKWIRIAGINPW